MYGSVNLYLVRHGETLWNAAGRIQGWIDVGLSEEGRRQSRKLQHELPSDTPLDLAVSPLRRARETALLFREHLRIRRCWYPPEFRELNQGFWNGLRGDWLHGRRGDRYHEWVDQPEKGCPPGGESLRDVRHRVARGLRFVGRRGGDDVVVVAHKVVNSLCAHLLGAWSLVDVMGSLGDNASVLRLQPDRDELVTLHPDRASYEVGARETSVVD